MDELAFIKTYPPNALLNALGQLDWLEELHALLYGRPTMKMFSRVVVHDAQGRVLVLHNVARNRWEFPGGKLEPGESHQAAAIRETFEETGLIIPRVYFLCQRRLITETGDWFGNFFTAPNWSGLPMLCEPTHDEFRFVTLDELERLPQIPSVTLTVAGIAQTYFLRRPQPPALANS